MQASYQESPDAIASSHIETQLATKPPEQLLREARQVFQQLGFKPQRANLVTRCLEIFVALTAIFVLAPIYVVIAVAVKRGSSGPILFRQSRIREGLTPFTFYKFRSLYSDSPVRFPHLYQFVRTGEELQTFKFKLENDPRITREGKWLRSSSLDELPNFWNLLLGDIALVGPRPEIPEMLPNYADYMLKKFSIRPGITGLAQISGRSDLTFLEGLEYDLKYVDCRSLWLDIKILLLTAVKCFLRDGAR